MDLLKAELERKRRAVAASSSSYNNGNSSGRRGDDDRHGANKKKRYLTSAQRRRLEEEEEEEREEEERQRRKEKRRKKKKKRRRGDDSDDDDSEDEKETEDLTTLLTKKYDPTARFKKSQAAAAAAEAAARAKNNDDAKVKGGDHDDGGNNEAGNATTGKKDQSETEKALRKLSPKEVTATLRRFGLPVRLFGEQTIAFDRTAEDNNKTYDDSARLERLLSAVQGREAAMLGETEADEYKLDSANRTRNVFLEKDDADAINHHEAEDGKKKKSKSSGDAGKEDGAPAPALTEEELNDKPKRIYRYFKSLLRQWEEDLALRPDALKRTAAGKNETKTLKQCKDYIRPLFHLCRHRELEEGLQTHLFKIVTYCEEGEFVKAHDAYIDVAIGRAAWPIGVTMVGIHARSGRAKIESSNVAHVMNSELHRKYLTSVKRLMSYNQRKRPDVHPSKKVMNL